MKTRLLISLLAVVLLSALGCKGSLSASTKTKATSSGDWVALIDEKRAKLDDVPSELRNRDVLRAALDSCSTAECIQTIAVEPAFDAGLAILAVSAHPISVLDLPDRLRNSFLIESAFQAEPRMLYRAPKSWPKNKSAAELSLISRLAFEADHQAIFVLPENQRTAEMLATIIKSKEIVSFLYMHSDDLEKLAWNDNLASKTFQLDHRMYGILPEQYRTFERSKIIVSEKGEWLEWVPREKKFANNGELCRIALRNNDKAAKYVPDYFLYRFN